MSGLKAIETEVLQMGTLGKNLPGWGPSKIYVTHPADKEWSRSLAEQIKTGSRATAVTEGNVQSANRVKNTNGSVCTSVSCKCGGRF